ncbi:hypothetical protein JHC09_03705 [Devosia sp. MC532]|uniref:hypothetical protein n=1 Tax=Devosia sp. MC532 TaxID=2799788 RepID=UPI0018F68268|nr:hypothetical protein [Devosia sp. MC532]MBJ7576989.1 hypothetical protein [Devosia sp. MC532]
MKRFLTGAALLFCCALAVPALGASGECSLTGYDSFACDVAVDGGGITFALPNGDTFVFAHEADGAGPGYVIAADSQPGRSPAQLGRFFPVADRDGCWFAPIKEITFCASIAE